MLDNKQTTRTRLLLGVAAVGAAAGLSACSGGGSDTSIDQPPIPAPMGAARFGPTFGAVFAASPNSDPRDPLTTDVIALSLTTDPLEVP